MSKAILIATLLTSFVNAQPPITLREALERALKNYPSIRVSQERISAATAGIDLARTAYLPKVDAIAQVNRGTRNNVFGILFPQSVIPSISGPVIGSNNFGTVFGSALGVLVSWEPFDFGLRKASIDAADLARAQSEAAKQRTQFEIACATADAFVTLLAAEQTVHAAEAVITRTDVTIRTTTSLVEAELRPGADRSRAEAEAAAARTQLIQARQTVELAKVNLAQFIGGEATTLSISPGGMLGELPPVPTTFRQAASNPFVVEQITVIEQARAQLRILERSYFPKFALQGSAYARGTGAELNGGRLGTLNGLGPDTQNYAVGFTVTFPISERPAIRAKEALQEAQIRMENAKKDVLLNDLKAQWNRAVVTVDATRRIVLNTPTQVKSAKSTLEQATARYQAGLGTISEVAEAQRLLAQAEIDDSLARLSLWRALLGVAIAAGDLEPWVAEANR